MTDATFDPQDPPGEPPAGADQVYWRVAVRLFRDHAPDRRPTRRPSRCRQCRQPWPCAARRVAERGLVAALRRGRPGPRRSDRWHSLGHGSPGREWDDAG